MAKSGVLLRLERNEGMIDDSEKVHVLAVDDSLVDRKVIERLLRITSFKVTAVDSGWRALQFLGLDGDENSAGLHRLKVDLVITDYCMPGMTGYDLLKKIKGSSAFRKVPVVIMSSENVLARIHRCLEEGAEDFIVKPVKLSDIKRLKTAMFGRNEDNTRTEEVVQTKAEENSSKTPTVLPESDNTPSPNSTKSESSSLSPTSPLGLLILKEKDTLKDPHSSPLELLLKEKPPLNDKDFADRSLSKDEHSVALEVELHKEKDIAEINPQKGCLLHDENY